MLAGLSTVAGDAEALPPLVNPESSELCANLEEVWSTALDEVLRRSAHVCKLGMLFGLWFSPVGSSGVSRRFSKAAMSGDAAWLLALPAWFATLAVSLLVSGFAEIFALVDSGKTQSRPPFRHPDKVSLGNVHAVEGKRARSCLTLTYGISFITLYRGYKVSQ
jgi:hypothetical protein